MPASLGGEGALRYRARKRVKNWMRELKASMSSDFEQAFLKATRPDSQAPKPKHVESIALSIGAFEAYTSPSCDPYGSLLHKAWSRCAETDARSTTKAIYVLHRLASSPVCCGEKEFSGLANAYRELCGQIAKTTHTHYFDRKAVLRTLAPQKDVSYSTKKWRKFLERYFGFVDGCWRFAGLEPPESAREACEVSLDLSRRAAETMRALPAPPRDNPLVAAVARRLQADAHGYAAALLVAALATGLIREPSAETPARRALGVNATAAPTTAGPTPAPTTALPSYAPTTARPTRRPTWSQAPTTALPTDQPTVS